MLVKSAHKSLIGTENTNYLEGVLLFVNNPSWGLSWLHYPNHVEACIRSEGRWIYYQPALDITSVDIVNHWTDIKKDGTIVVPFKILRKLNRYRMWFPFTVFSCVEGIKALLGINKYWILTPHRLYKYMNKLED